MKLEEKIENRQNANREIVRILSAMVESHPDFRFNQILFAIKIHENVTVPKVVNPLDVQVCKDKFYEESTDTLNALVETLKTL